MRPTAQVSLRSCDRVVSSRRGGCTWHSKDCLGNVSTACGGCYEPFSARWSDALAKHNRISVALGPSQLLSVHPFTHPDMLCFPASAFIMFMLCCIMIPDALAVSNSSKAGLAWPNGNWDNIEQYITTGRVSWYVLLCLSTHAELTPVKVLHMESKLDQLRPRVCAHALG